CPGGRRRLPPFPTRRSSDLILPLAERFVLEEGRHARFSPAAVRALTAYAWPGNVRELANAVKHGLALSEGLVIDVEHLPEEITRSEEHTSELQSREKIVCRL